MSIMQLDIVSLDSNIFSGSVELVTLTSMTGELTILPHHIALITPIRAGELCFQHDNEKTYLVVGDGFLTVQKNIVTVFVSSAHQEEDLDEEEILKAQQRAEELLKNKESLDHTEFADATALLERSIAQLKFVKKRRGKH